MAVHVTSTRTTLATVFPVVVSWFDVPTTEAMQKGYCAHGAVCDGADNVTFVGSFVKFTGRDGVTREVSLAHVASIT